MECLGQISAVKGKIKLASRATIVVLHKIIFGVEGDRGNRQRLRESAGFTFDDNSDEFWEKMEFMAAFSIGDLVSVCNLLGIDHQGTKEQIRRNIIFALMDINTLIPVSEDDDSQDEEEDKDGEDRDGGRNNQNDENNHNQSQNGSVVQHSENRRNQVEHESGKNSVRFALSYKDVEESIRPFSGEDDYPVERWIGDFEEAALLFDWDDLRMLIFAKKSLKGLAKTFILGEKAIRTWEQLKNCLAEEFSSRLNSADLHQLLSERKRKKDEGVREYSLAMKELASRGTIEEDALIQYIIKGISDEESSKIILYGATKYSEFKEKLKAYERIKRTTPETTNLQKVQRNDSTKKPDKISEVKSHKKSDRCYACGEVGHRSKECPKKSLGLKCFKCQNYGHIARNCSKDVQSSGQNKSCNLVTRVTGKCEKDVIVNGVKIVALIDSGSDITLMREEQYKEIGRPIMKDSEIQFRGAGPEKFPTLGGIYIDVSIDDEIYSIGVQIVSNDVIRNGLIFGTDFLNTVELNVKKGKITISKIMDDEVPDVFRIDAIDTGEIELNHIKDDNVKKELTELIKNYSPEKSKETGVEMRIVLTDNIPVYERARRLAEEEKNRVEDQVYRWFKANIIRRSTADYSSSVVPTRKKDGTIRVCVDYRGVNSKTVKVRFPQPIIEEQLDKLQNAKVYTTLDLKDGFFHVPIEEESRKYTAFTVPSGQYEFNCAPFGFCNSPAYFSRYILAVFWELIAEKILILYIDDLLIPSSNVKEGLQRLRRVLNVASDYGLKINWKKCEFLRERVKYLGHVVEAGRISVSDDKTDAVKHFPIPKDARSLRSFLGLTGYFRMFIPQYALVARPLSDLLKKNVEFKFGEAQVNAFETLRRALSEKPVLHLYRTSAETELHTDASALGFGAILLQRSDEDDKMHPIYYASGKTSPAESRYDSYKLEVMAIVKALKKFRVYLIGIDFVIVTDCKAFTQTMKKKDLCGQIAKWALRLEEFRYTIMHRPGKNMQHVDALSRHPLPATMIIRECESSIAEKIRRCQDVDQDLKKLKEQVNQNEIKGYCVSNGLLLKIVNGEELIVVPKLMQVGLIRQTHEQGHFSSDKTIKLIKDNYWFLNMQGQVAKVIRNCIACILAEKKSGKKEGFLHAIPKEMPLDTYHIDHLGPMPSTKKNYRHILVVVDAFTKFVWLYPTRSTTAAEIVDRLSKQALVFGNPKRIVSDRGTAFTSQEFEEYCKSENIDHHLIVTGVPRGNGQVERVNRTLIPVLTKLSMPHPETWHKYIGKAQQYLNHVSSRSTGFSPFVLQFGVPMKLKEDLRIRETIEKEFLEDF